MQYDNVRNVLYYCVGIDNKTYVDELFTKSDKSVFLNDIIKDFEQLKDLNQTTIIVTLLKYILLYDTQENFYRAKNVIARFAISEHYLNKLRKNKMINFYVLKPVSGQCMDNKKIILYKPIDILNFINSCKEESILNEFNIDKYSENDLRFILERGIESLQESSGNE
jgi:hypothetical protein